MAAVSGQMEYSAGQMDPADLDEQYDDNFDDYEDVDDGFGAPPEYVETAATGRYANTDVDSVGADSKSYLDYNPAIFDDDMDGAVTPPDSGTGTRASNIPQFNNDAAQMIANQLNNLIDSRVEEGSENVTAAAVAAATMVMNDTTLIESTNNNINHDGGLVPEAVVAAGSALSAVRTRSGGSDASPQQPAGTVAAALLDPSLPSDKAMRSFRMTMGTDDSSSNAVTGTNRGNSDKSGGLNHRQTLRALKAKKEGGILSSKRGRGGVVIEGEEGEGGEGLQKENNSTNANSSSSGGDGKPRGGPVVRQIVRRKTAKEIRAEAEEVAKAEETDEEREKRKQAHKTRKAKMAEMLATLQKAKSEEAEEKRKKEAAQKKRKAILTARVIAESAERTSMGKEDKPRYRAIVLEKEKIKQQPAVAVTEPPAVSAKRAAAAEKNKQTAAVISKNNNNNVNAADNDVDGDGDDGNNTTSKSGKKISTTQSDALFNRLKARQQKTSDGIDLAASQSVPARDFSDWKRKNNVPSDGQVFAMTGWYPCVKQALLDRGWYHNTDPESPFFDLKWTLRSLQTDQEALQPWQLTNHFLKNMAITTKVGLLKSLRSLTWLADVGCNDVIPRGYDLSNDQEMQAFIDDYRLQHAEIILKNLYKSVTGINFPPLDIDGDFDGGDDVEGVIAAVENNKNIAEEKENTNDEDEILISGEDEQKRNFKMPITPRFTDESVGDMQINEAVFDTCCDVLERYLRPTHDAYIDTADDNTCLVYNTHAAMSSLQWEILSNATIHEAYSVPVETPESIDAFLPGNEHMFNSEDGSSTAAMRARKGVQDKLESNKNNAAQQREMKAKERREKSLREQMVNKAKSVRQICAADVSRMHRILNNIYCCDRNQSGLNGTGDLAKNIWIVKPGAKSRGRGICTFADLPKLLKYVDAGTGSAQSAQWVVQKYMENPLTIANHKFDLRQWVVVTDWNPLTVWFYDECYARFSVEPYNTKDGDLENSYVHLVNNSISKQSEEFKRKIMTENGEAIEGYMWSHEQMSNWIQHQTGRDLMKEKIKTRMMDIAKWSLMCASECIEHRKNSWELYGFDFMVDDNYNTWLIEINSSPACDYSTDTTERYVQKALVELLSVTLDMREWESKSKKKRGEKPDTGGWSCIHKGPVLDMTTAAFGIDMSLKGDGIKLPKRRSSNPNIGAGGQVPFSNSAKRAAAAASGGGGGGGGGGGRMSQHQHQQQRETSSPPPAPSRSVPAPRAPRTFRVPSNDDGDDELGIAEGQLLGTSPSKHALMRGSLDLASQSSLMNDSMSLNDSMETMGDGGGGGDDGFDIDDSDAESELGRTRRQPPQNSSNVAKVLLAKAKAQQQQQQDEEGVLRSPFRSPLTQQLLAKREQTRNEAKFKLSSDGDGYHSGVRGNPLIPYGTPPPIAPGGDSSNSSGSRQQQLAQVTLGFGNSTGTTTTGATPEQELQRTVMMRRQVKEMRALKAQGAKINAVPPVGRDNMVVKSKVFELPF